MNVDKMREFAQAADIREKKKAMFLVIGEWLLKIIITLAICGTLIYCFNSQRYSVCYLNSHPFFLKLDKMTGKTWIISFQDRPGMTEIETHK
ncbi:MAG TPA: hypothetical protein DCZ94_21635 [Lentisphaeria bacterium]|nr:MAG: hypothetical protein A2X48_14565 [Lentisphaerae bacterium GWF2_49_21]HBC89548.1 hypothetical protein [Lentisphaeria bacterium]